MTPSDFPGSNTTFRPPPDASESQVGSIRAMVGQVGDGSLDGACCIVTAWRLSPGDLAKLQAGSLVYLTCISGLPPHSLSVDPPSVRPNPS